MHSGPHPHCHKCQDIVLFSKYGFIYFGCAGWWLWCTGFPQLWKGGYSLHVGCGLWGTRATVVVVQGPQSTGLVVVAHRLSCTVACGTFPDQESNLCAPHLCRQILLTTEPPGKSHSFFFWLSSIPLGACTPHYSSVNVPIYSLTSSA